MKKHQIKAGRTYLAKVNGKVVPVTVDRIADGTYHFTNTATGRKSSCASAQRFKEEVKPATVPFTKENQATPISTTPSEGDNRPDPTKKASAQTADGTQFTADVSTAKDQSQPTDRCVVSVDKFGGKEYTYGFGKLEIKNGDRVMVPTNLGQTVGTVVKLGSDYKEAVKNLLSKLEGETLTAPAQTANVTDPRSVDLRSVTVTRQSLGSQVAAQEASGLTSKLKDLELPKQAAKHPLTEEQQAIITTAPSVQVLVIEAGAGAGKTSTLVRIAESMPGKGQYTAFNTALVAESKTKFGGSVSCNTIHSLAFRSEGTKHAHRLGGNRVKSREIAGMLGLEGMTVTGPDDKPKHLGASLLANSVVRGLRNFCQSADKQVVLAHMPRLPGVDKEHSHENADAIREYLLPFALKMWADKCDPQGKLPFMHDDYVKIWELNDPFIPADYVLIDESQDMAPCMLSIIEQQIKKGTKAILVGDSAQQIYTWRGSVNAMLAFPDAPRLMLSQSFRFGQVVAEVANSILQHLQEKTPLIMRGFDKINSKLGTLDNPTAILCRTNAGAVSHLLDGITKGKHPHMIGGGDDVTAFVRAARDLQTGKSTNHPELCSFANWKEVVEYSATEDGEDLRLMVKIIKGFGVEKLLSALENMPDEKDADLLISTAHRSKGREWSSVKLAGDFFPLNRGSDEEVRLLYVAATRAQHVLDVDTCPPFCGGRDRDGNDLPIVNISKARQLSKELPSTSLQPLCSAPETAPVFNAKASQTEQPESSPAKVIEGNSWAKSKDGNSWLVRGKPGQTGEIEVRKKDGRITKETIKKVVWQNHEAALYQV